MGFGCMNAIGNYGPAPDKNQGIGVIRAGHEKGVTLFDTAEVMCPPDSGWLKGNNGIEIIEWLAYGSSGKTTTNFIKHAAEGLTGAIAICR
jgi:aryl-alcohol dehydrogenase-like predicted oxidoreductase